MLRSKVSHPSPESLPSNSQCMNILLASDCYSILHSQTQRPKLPPQKLGCSSASQPKQQVVNDKSGYVEVICGGGHESGCKKPRYSMHRSHARLGTQMSYSFTCLLRCLILWSVIPSFSWSTTNLAIYCVLYPRLSPLTKCHRDRKEGEPCVYTQIVSDHMTTVLMSMYMLGWWISNPITYRWFAYTCVDEITLHSSDDYDVMWSPPPASSLCSATVRRLHHVNG